MTQFLRYGTVFIICLGAASSFGQARPVRITSIGLAVGLGPTFTPASLDYLELRYSNYLAATNRPGVAATLAAFVRVQQGSWFWQPELRYQDLTSAKFEVPGGGGGFGSLFSGPFTRTFHVRQLATTILRGYSFGAHQQFYGFLGPALALRLGNNGEPTPDASTNPSQSARLDYAMDQAPTKMQAQLQGGVGRRGRHFGVEARYLYGLTPLVRNFTFEGQRHDFKVGSSALLLAVTYQFSANESLR